LCLSSHIPQITYKVYICFSSFWIYSWNRFVTNYLCGLFTTLWLLGGNCTTNCVTEPFKLAVLMFKSPSSRLWHRLDLSVENKHFEGNFASIFMLEVYNTRCDHYLWRLRECGSLRSMGWGEEMTVSLDQWKRRTGFHARAPLELSLRTGNRKGGGWGCFVRPEKSAVLRKADSNNCSMIWNIPVSLLVFCASCVSKLS